MEWTKEKPTELGTFFVAGPSIDPPVLALFSPSSINVQTIHGESIHVLDIEWWCHVPEPEPPPAPDPKQPENGFYLVKVNDVPALRCVHEGTVYERPVRPGHNCRGFRWDTTGGLHRIYDWENAVLLAPAHETVEALVKNFGKLDVRVSGRGGFDILPGYMRGYGEGPTLAQAIVNLRENLAKEKEQ